MTSEPALLFAVVEFEHADRRAVTRVVAPFPDRSSAAAYALDNGLHGFAVGPMAFAVPTTFTKREPTRAPATASAGPGWMPAQRRAVP